MILIAISIIGGYFIGYKISEKMVDKLPEFFINSSCLALINLFVVETSSQARFVQREN